MAGYIRKTYKAKNLRTVDEAVGFALGILSAVNEGLLVTDDRFGVVFANAAFCDIVGKPGEDLSGFDFGKWLKRLGGVWPDNWSDADGSNLRFRYKMETDGNPTYFSVRVTPLKLHFPEVSASAPQGPPLFVSVWRDVTAQKRDSDALKKKEAETEKADREKETFFSSMNHEVRTPMNGIIGMLELAMDDELSRKQKEYLALARCSAETLLNMLNNFFNFSKGQAGKLAISQIVFSLDAVMESIISSMRIGIREKGLRMVHSVDPDVPDLLKGDPDRLRQVLANLIGNAIKFTDKGEIRVAVTNEGCPSDPEQEIALGFSVKDTGIGIPESKHETIFESFVQADESIGKSYGGAGLGLSISRQIVRLMGGELRMESVVGKGSVFRFTACFGKVDKKTDYRAEPDAPSGKRPEILVVEDDKDLRDIFREFLENEGYGVTGASNGRVALELFDDRRFEIILMDIGLPGLDGFQVSKKIREKNADIPIIALTGNYRHEDEVEAAGLNDFLSKPISRKRILDAVKAELGKYRRKKAESPATKPEKRPGPGKGSLELCEGICREVDRLKRELNSGQFDRVKNIAHELKAMASDAGAQNLADEAFRLKLAARKGDPEKMAVLVGKIENESEILKNEMNRDESR